MISQISGKVVEKKAGAILVGHAGLSYEILIPGAIMKTLENKNAFKDQIQLVTYHYYQMEPSRGVPVLIGFQNNVEKEFFEKFISVSGIGPKAACRALAEPFSSIAGAIDRGDVLFLKKLPGIGERKAGEIVAKLKGKVGKYGLIRDKDVAGDVEHEDIRGEALEILQQLQYKTSEAEGMIDKALARDSKIKTSEDLLNEVYKDRCPR